MPIDVTDEGVLSMVEGEMLGTRLIEELLALVDRGDAHERTCLLSNQARLRLEIERLVGSIAAGIPPETVAPQIRERSRSWHASKRGSGFLVRKCPTSNDSGKHSRFGQSNADRLRACSRAKSPEWS